MVYLCCQLCMKTGLIFHSDGKATYWRQLFVYSLNDRKKTQLFTKVMKNCENQGWNWTHQLPNTNYTLCTVYEKTIFIPQDNLTDHFLILTCHGYFLPVVSLNIEQKLPVIVTGELKMSTSRRQVFPDLDLR